MTYVDGDETGDRPDGSEDDRVAVSVLSAIDEPGEDDGENHGKDGSGRVEEVGACVQNGERKRGEEKTLATYERSRNRAT